MTRPVVITCAVTGAADSTRKNPAVPVTPSAIAAEALAAHAAGAAIVHLHVRDPETGAPSMEFALYREVVERIRASGADVVLNLTTGPGARFVPDDADPPGFAEDSRLRSPEARAAHLSLRPQICSLDIATMNFGSFAFVNTPAHIERIGALAAEAGAKPELEVFDLGHIRLAKHLLAEGRVKTDPPLFQLCLGVPWGAPASVEALVFMQRELPPGAPWSAFGVGPTQHHITATTIALGGHVRVGLEDNLYVDKGVLASGNAALVERAVAIIRALGHRPASTAEARELFHLG